MAKIQDLTVKVTLSGALDYDKIAEEVKAAVQREVERVGVSVNVGESKYRKVTDRDARVGDYVKFSETDDDDITIGKYYEVTGFDCDGDPEFNDDDNDGNVAVKDWGEEFEFYEKVVAEPSPESFKVGDYVKVVGQPNHYQHNTIVEIVGTDYCEDLPYDTRNLDGSPGDIHSENDLVKATYEEVAEAKRQQAEKAVTAKWVSINRKPNEFKKGDIVEITEYENGLHVGTLAEVRYVNSAAVGTDGVKDGEFLTCYGASLSAVKLVAPVESRIDR